METRTCLQCNDDFPQHNDNDKRLFCSSKCRLKFWVIKDPKRKKGLSTSDQIDDLKYEMHDAINQIKNIRSHLDRVEHDYQDWEDRIVAIENKVYELEKEVGIEEEQLQKQLSSKKPKEADFNAFDELFKDV